MMPEKVIQDLPSSSCLRLRSAARQTYHTLLVGVKSVNKIYDILFQGLLDEVKQLGEKNTKGVDEDFCNPLYNICRIAESAI